MKAALVISGADNVATALETLEPGRRLDLDGRVVIAVELIPSGHKIALVDIPPGEPVIKYGSPIGSATAAILQGAHVHAHNLSSGRGRGDLRGSIERPASARLAEPPDALIDRSPEESESSSAAGRARGGGAPRAGEK